MSFCHKPAMRQNNIGKEYLQADNSHFSFSHCNTFCSNSAYLNMADDLYGITG